MLTKLHELKSKRDKLMAEDEIKRSPSQEREYLLEQVGCNSLHECVITVS